MSKLLDFLSGALPCEEQTVWRAQVEMRAAAHATDSILQGLETEDTK